MLFLQRTVGNQAVGRSVRNAVRTPGQPLDASLRTLMESRFGQDFGGVRVHTDATAAESAADIQAEAYTIGQDVVFGDGEYQPATESGRTLLAHELAHTVQQRDGTGAPPSNDPHAIHETSARTAAHDIAHGRSAGTELPASGVGLSMSPDDEKEVKEEELRKEKPVRRIGEIPTTSSLIPVDPRRDVDQLIKQQPSDPDWDAYVAQRDFEERNRRIKQEVNDELRTDRFVALRKFLEEKPQHRDDLAPFLSENYTMRDLQILRHYGFEWGTRSKGSTNFQQTLVKAIEAYLADQDNQRFGGAATMREWTQADEDARVKKLQQEAHYKAWLEGLSHVTGSVLGGASAWVASQFTDDPEKITAWAGFGTALSGVLGPISQAKGQQGSYVPEAEVPFSAPGGARYKWPAPTKAADIKTPAVETPGTPEPSPLTFPRFTDFSKELQSSTPEVVPPAAAPKGQAQRTRSAAPDDVVNAFIERLNEFENPFSLNIGERRASKIMSGEKDFALDSPIAFDVDEPLAVGAEGLKPQRAVDRARDPHNRQLLDPQTNRITKHTRESEADVARHRECLAPVSLRENPNAVFTRRFDEVIELNDVFRQAENQVQNMSSLKPTALKAAINKNIRAIIRDGSTPAGRVVRDTLHQLGFEYVEGRGFVAVSSRARAPSE